MSIYMHLKGAKVYGYSLKQDKKLAMFNVLKLNKIFEKSQYGDIRNKNKLLKFFNNVQPQLAIHMAAQPIVLESYRNPSETYKVNINGTINFLESCLHIKNLKGVIVVTSDKCYENIGPHKKGGYNENDKLGGKDPYSASKACAEIVSKSYQHSFFKKKKINLATVRAGNAIGGGDWSDFRLFVDLAKFLFLKKKMQIRNPKSIRPWQHVMEPITGYALLLQKLYEGKNFNGSWNFGPLKKDCISVEKILKIIKSSDEKIDKIELKNKILHEEEVLNLDITKVQKKLKWKPKINIEKAIELTLNWYRFMFNNKKKNKSIFNYTVEQIKIFEKIN